MLFNHRFSMIFVFLLIVSSISPLGHAEINIPRGLDQTDRLQALTLLGLPTTAKLNTSSYPLGDYWGVEVALSYETFSVEGLSLLGTQSEAQDNISYPLVTIGKGLLYDIDAFVQFAPGTDATGISQFGGLARWKFLEFKTIPIHFSALFHYSSTDFQNQITTRATGYAITSGFYFRGFSLYGGMGRTFVKGRFTGDEDGVNDNGLNDEAGTFTARLNERYNFVGLSFLYSNVFISAETTLWDEPSTSLKLGFRF